MLVIDHLFYLYRRNSPYMYAQFVKSSVYFDEAAEFSSVVELSKMRRGRPCNFISQGPYYNIEYSEM